MFRRIKEDMCVIENGQIDGQMDGQIDGQMDRWMDRQMDRWMKKYGYLESFIHTQLY